MKVSYDGATEDTESTEGNRHELARIRTKENWTRIDTD